MMEALLDGLNLHLIVIVSAGVTLIMAVSLGFVVMKDRGSKGKEEIPGASTISCDNSLEAQDLDKETYPGGQINILYASQTGTAEDFANQIESEGITHGFKIRVIDLEDATEKGEESVQKLLAEEYRDERGRSRAIFLTATYGEGEPTDNSEAFVRMLKERTGVKTLCCDLEEKLDPEWLKGMEYAVFGLGNTQYEHYNAMGKFFDEALQKAGGTRITKLGLGDDDNDLEADFETWKEQVLWPALVERYVTVEVKQAVSGKEEKFSELPFTVKFLNDGNTCQNTSNENIHTSAKHYFDYLECPVKSHNELLSPNKLHPNASTRHIEIDISNKLNYTTADNLGVLPVNDISLVESVASSLSYDLNATFDLVPNKDAKHVRLFPTPCTIRELLSKYCDLTSPPRRSELKQLAQFASDPIDRDALLRMSSKEGKKEYFEKVVNMHIGTADIITRLCPSIKIPLAHFIHICPRLQPRYYTISSSSSVYPKEVHLTLAVISHERKDGTVFEGVCSNYLKKVGVGESLRVFLRPSTFRLPDDPSKPIIMIGPGTGIAPMRGLLQERSHQQTQNLSVGPSILYFGCKYSSIDYLYKNEILDFQKKGTLTHLYTAFSRDQKQKVYVQHLLAKNGKETWDLIDNQGAFVYICGAIKMGQDVCETLRGIMVKEGGMDLEEAKGYCSKMHDEGRLIQELWA